MELGNISKRPTLPAHGMGLEFLASDPYPDDAFARENEVELVTLEELLAWADYVSLRVFGGSGNAALMDTGALAQMTPTAWLINLARGEVVDLYAVAQAIEADRFGAVAIGAYVSEPPDTAHPFFAHA